MLDIVDAAKIQEWGERYSNVGRWGSDDARGTLNFITRARVRAACALPRLGLVISCALPFDRRARHPETAAPERAAAGAAAPALATQWCSQSNVFYDRPSKARRASEQAERRNGAGAWRDAIQDGVIGRGVLLDFPRFLRRPWLDDGTRIQARDLDNCAEALGVAVEPGDIVLVRTGRLTRCFHQGSWNAYCGGPAPGLSVRCARWLHEREIAALASDTWSVEVIPGEAGDGSRPLHQLALHHMGLLLGEMFHLDTLAEACANDGDYAFLLSAPLLPALGAVGYPINPLAVK
ncbi:MAG: cyclase family protein [Myxococcales bacterium]|nr:cyclase family protein [Myxococcales bacterium]MDH5306521.1 cyclase family protein [Myxococcales bacterium]MDH5566166.1 cyclase family protein [Myxococcales bacterium]